MDLDSLSYYKYGAFISVLRYSVLRYAVCGTSAKDVRDVGSRNCNAVGLVYPPTSRGREAEAE